ncbi:MAG: IS1182 family transposase [Bacteroidetes bacterium]|nr:IS1182 family transposase [Bacteroidota bacterium]
MQHVQGQNRKQIKMISLEQMVEPESMVRVIDAFVDMLDLEQFGFSYFTLNKEGRPPFHPAVMMKIYLYGYQNGIRSCRRLEKACTNNIEMMWLISEQRPHFKTIANFRKDNTKAFKKVFRYFVVLLKDWKLIDGKTIAIDSFKIRAQNSLKNNFNEQKVKRHIDYIDKKIAEYELALDQEFNEQTRDKLEHNKQKKKKYEHLNQKLKQSGDGQLSTTDPDSKAVVFQRNSVKVGYNIQAVSDSKYNLLVAADTGDVNDTKALSVMVEETQQNIGDPEGEEQMNVLADKGYHSGRELKACEQLGVTTYVSPKESTSPKANPEFAMKNFDYDESRDRYTCPADETLNTNGRWYNKKGNNGKKSYRVKHYKTKACKDCHLSKQCTTNKMGRIIERTEFAEYTNRNNDRVKSNPQYYRQRQQIIEHQFGTLKRHRQFDYTLMKGKDNVLAEVYLAFTMYNLGRTMSTLGFSGLMERIKAVLWLFWHFFSVRILLEDLRLVEICKHHKHTGKSHDQSLLF